MAPITLQRLVKQLDKLKPEADAARLKSHDYARRLARMIRQLRERGLDADRAAATAALVEVLRRGAITAPMEASPLKRRGPSRPPKGNPKPSPNRQEPRREKRGVCKRLGR